jgi:hypothetical protein
MKQKMVGLLGAIGICALAAQPVAAATIGFTASGTGSDGALAASATVTTSAGHVDVVLSNDLAANIIRSAGQAVSDFAFTLSNAPGTLGSVTASGQLANISVTGGVTFVSGSPTRWLNNNPGGFNISGNTVTLEAIGGGQPDQLLLPSNTNGGSFPNANGGSLGGGQFDPFIIGPVTFGLNLAGVTPDTTITSALFSFGTGPDTFLPGTRAVPGPIAGAGLPGLIMAFGGLVTWARRRRKAAAA